jgi:hypothetical protein
MATATTQTTLLDLPPELLALVARSAPLDFASLCRAASACRALRVAFSDDGAWQRCAERRWPGLPLLLSQASPRWYARDGGAWRRRAARLLSGAPFSVQVLNREADAADDEDFGLSAYDAVARLQQTSRGGGAAVGARRVLEVRLAALRAEGEVEEGQQTQQQQHHHHHHHHPPPRRAPDASAGQPLMPVSAPPKPHELQPSVEEEPEAAAEAAEAAPPPAPPLPPAAERPLSAASSSSSSSSSPPLAPPLVAPAAATADADPSFSFVVTYLPMGSGSSGTAAAAGAAAATPPATTTTGRVVEAGVRLARLRAAPAGVHPYRPLRALPALRPGAAVEVQWRGGRSHPFGLWLGTVRSVERQRPPQRQLGWPAASALAASSAAEDEEHDDEAADSAARGPITAVRVTFDQYPPASAWHCVEIPVWRAGAGGGGGAGGAGEEGAEAAAAADAKAPPLSADERRRRRRRQRRREAAAAAAAASNNPICGLIGGVRVLTDEERVQWAAVRPPPRRASQAQAQ